MPTQNLEVLLNSVKQISARYEELARLSGERFNVFKIIGLANDEVKMHSRFIAELLNPQGAHEQQDSFLKLFLEGLDFKNFETKTAKVYVEKSIGAITSTDGGRIDILIEDSKSQRIAIENKIYASDQEKQLLRYHNYSKAPLLYLTLFGDSPSEESAQGLKEDEHYFCISYSEYILDWLDKCRKEAANLPLLREGISHYIHLIQYLTGKTGNKSMNNEIKNLLVQSPGNLQAAMLLTEALVEAKALIQYQFWHGLINTFKQQGVEVNPSNITLERMKAFYKKKPKSKYHGLSINIYSSNSLVMSYGMEIWESVYFGFRVTRNNSRGISDEPEFEPLRQFIQSLDSNYKNTKDSKWWLGHKYNSPPLNFAAFNQDVCKLADKNQLKELVESMVQNALEEIKQVQAKLRELYPDGSIPSFFRLRIMGWLF